MRNMVVGIYAHPEAYPPTLNALNELSDSFTSIAVVHRPLLKSNWSYPDNIITFSKGTQMSEFQQVQSSLPKKIMYFISYTMLLLRTIRRYKPSVILVYDSIALYSYHLIRPFTGYAHKVWYHNHDVVEAESQRKYSIGWMALKSERKSFEYLSVFTLPAQDRLPYFDLSRFTGRYFYLPNFPAKKMYEPYKSSANMPSRISLIFQGSMDDTHGIEEIIPVLKRKILEKELMLKLLGKSRPAYKQNIQKLSETYQVNDKVKFEGLQPYRNIPEISSSCHIGLAIYRKQDVMNKTISTASNKIYEYAAVGLPVLVFDNEYHRTHLSKYSWIFFTDCSVDSYCRTLESIVEQYGKVSDAARNDCMNHLNFEAVFKQVKDYIITIQ